MPTSQASSLPPTRSLGAKHSWTVMGLSVLLALFIFILDLVFPLGIAGGVPYIAVILVSLASQVVRFTVAMAIVCTVLTLIGMFYSPLGSAWEVVLMNRALSVFAIWITTYLATNLIRESQTELTRQRSLRRQLELTYNRLKAILEHSQSGIIMRDPEGRVLEINRFALALLERDTPEEVIGKTNSELFEPELARKFDAIDIEVMDRGKPLVTEETFRIEGIDRTFLTVNYRTVGADGETTGVCLMATDITERKLMEENLLSLKQEAETASEAKADFLASMSHEIRTPMNAIGGISEILDDADDLTPERRKQLYSVLKASASDLKTLINSLLDLSKLEAGKMELEEDHFDIRKALNDTASMLRVAAEEKGLTLRHEVQEDVPESLWGDEMRIGQIITNLTSNAIKFTEQGEVRIDVRIDSLDESRLILSISDTGVGISKEDAERIFDRFSQLKNSSGKMHRGTGLGLSIVKRLVELLSGEIRVESQEGQGSVFTVSLPVKIPPGTYRGTRLSGDQARPSEPLFPCSGDAEKYPVLVVEDNAANRLVLCSFLDKLGCHYETATSGREGLKLFKTGRFPIALLDIQMEDMDGLTLAQEIRRWEQEQDRASAQIYAVTGHVHPEVRNKCVLAGMNGFLAKPLEFKALRDCIEEIKTVGTT